MHFIIKSLSLYFFYWLIFSAPLAAQFGERVGIEDMLHNGIWPEWEVTGYTGREFPLIDPDQYVGRIQYFYSYKTEGPFLNCKQEATEAAWYGGQYKMKNILKWTEFYELKNHKVELGLEDDQVFQVWQVVCRDSIGSFYPFLFSYKVKEDIYGHERITDHIGYALVGGTIFILKHPDPVQWDFP